MAAQRNPGAPAAKPWSGRFSEPVSDLVKRYTASVFFDNRMAEVDIQGSLAHAEMLCAQGIITTQDHADIQRGMAQILDEIRNGQFTWLLDLEDVHLNIEKRLTELVGDAGKRLHTGRSRNDQVATDIRLYLRGAIDQIVGLLKDLRAALINLAEQNTDTILPGFTHMQVAQPITFGHHMLAYVEMFSRDTERLLDCRKRVNRLPLGAAALAGTHAKVVMLEQSSPARIAACKASGAEILLAPDVHQAFAWAKQIAEEESRTMIHPFEGPLTAEGTSTVGLELMQQVPQLDAVIVPIGGGGLCAGIAAAVKQINPACAVYGVEPEGADSMSRSLRSGQPEKLEKVSTVADSLGAPFALPYSFGVCQRFVDDVVKVSDDALCQAMYFLFRDMKLVTEPATAASTAALLGPLKETLNGKKVGLIVCGANIDTGRYSELLARGQALAEKP